MLSTKHYNMSIKVAMMVFLCLLGIEKLSAQAIQFAPAFGQDEDSIKGNLISSMKIEIDAIRRIADLPENTVKKLNIAAIQAVDAAIKNNPPQRMGGRMPQPLPRAGGKPPKEGTLSDEDEEDKAKKDEEAPDANANFLPGMFFQIDIKIVKKQEPWKKVLASLDPAKVAAIEAFEKKRTKDLRDFRVASKVQELDDMLLLSASQRTELTEIVDRLVGDQLALQPRNNGIFAGGAMVVVMAGQASKEIPKDELKRVLSEVQFAEYENMLNRQAQGPFNPAAPPAGFGKNKKNNNDEPQSSSLGFTFKEKESGLSVESVTPDSRADQAGLKAGDIIDGIDGKPIDNTVQLKRAIALNMSKTLTMQVKRDGTDLKLEFPSKK
jgi:hypothetical protein